MFKRFLLIITMLCAPAIAVAQPAYTNYYWGGYIGGVVDSEAEGEAVNGLNPSQSIDLRPDSDFTLGAVFGATIASNTRAELELAYKSTDSDGLTLGSAKSDASGGLSSTSLLLNFWYDFPTMGNIRPYAGAGLGIATVDNDVSGGGTRFDSSDEGITYQIGAGLQFPVSDRGTIDFGYRYQTVRKLAFESKSSPNTVYDDIDFITHSLQIGYRMNF